MLRKIILSLSFIIFTSNVMAQECSVTKNFDLLTPEFRENLQSFKNHTDEIDRLNREIATTLKDDAPETTNVVYGDSDDNSIGNPKITVSKEDGEFKAKFELLNLFFKFDSNECQLIQKLRSSQSDQSLVGKHGKSLEVINDNGQLLIGISNEQTFADLQKVIATAKMIESATASLVSMIKDGAAEKGKLMENKMIFITSIFSSLEASLQQ